LRITGSPATIILISVLNLGTQELTRVFPQSKDQPITAGPLELVWCPASQLLQLSHSFDAAEMYGDNYGYRSGLNQSMVSHLTTKIGNLEQRIPLGSGDCVIDIGSNDATTLKAYATSGLKRIGIDSTGPKFRSFYPPEIALISELFPSPSLKSSIGDSKVKVVTSIAMFYDLEEPIAFTRSIAELLAREHRVMRRRNVT